MLPLDARPIIIAVAGPNGAGKSTFFETHLKPAGLRFITPTTWDVNWVSAPTNPPLWRTGCARN